MAAIGYCAEESEMICKLWKNGKSALEVATVVNQRFGRRRTRNAVIGHVHRLGLPHRGKGAANPVRLPAAKRMKAGATTVAKKRAQTARLVAQGGAPASKSGISGTGAPQRHKSPPEATRARFLLSPAPPLGLDVLELTDSRCRYAVSDKVPHSFCGHPVKHGKHWCEAHYERVYRRPEVADV